jgi:preprotein translocase subunit YajC
LAADPNDHALSLASLVITGTIGIVSVIRQRRRDRQDKDQAEATAVNDSIGTIGTLAVDIAKEIVAGTDDMIAAHRSEVSAEIEALREHVKACDDLTARQQDRIADLEARLNGPL